VAELLKPGVVGALLNLFEQVIATLEVRGRAGRPWAELTLLDERCPGLLLVELPGRLLGRGLLRVGAGERQRREG
jgi:hypothetical protein